MWFLFIRPIKHGAGPPKSWRGASIRRIGNGIHHGHGQAGTGCGATGCEYVVVRSHFIEQVSSAATALGRPHCITVGIETCRGGHAGVMSRLVPLRELVQFGDVR